MASIRLGKLNRRQLFTLGAGVATASLLDPADAPAAQAAAGSSGAIRQLTAAPSEAALRGGEARPTKVWSYNGSEPGPVLRVRQGAPLRALVRNGLAEGTTVHWHGIRLPNAMDGVPGLTQSPIAPGGTFEYTFTPPDAGTFWYHSHADSAVQLGRGLAGALIVEESDPPSFDRDLLWVIQDWRLMQDGQIAPGFANPMEEGMSGRVGNTVTINGRVPEAVQVRAGERLRLRLLNAASARIMSLRFEGHRPTVIALDGQPCEPHEPANERILLGPAMRVDIVLDALGDPGRSYPVIDDFYDRLSYTLLQLVYDTAPARRAHSSAAPLRLPANPVPRPDLASAVWHELRLQGGMMGGTGMGTMAGMGAGAAIWAINGVSMTGDGSGDMTPLFTVQRGRSCILDLRNETAWWHPMHLHGHSFHVISRDGVAAPHDEWSDTVLVRPRETVRVAFVADNPGDWMLHCHVMDHQVAGLMTTIRVA
ncbi:MAG: multicopper oxidase family protein [Alphaproteobacteria bacterium]|nr:multicopper oxidase family protein [Alphaproteobacteria bacterium]